MNAQHHLTPARIGMGYAAAQKDPMQRVLAWLLLMIGQIRDG
ncbi:MAG: hypothetical protein NT074_02790 [Methanomicrobiales archaeon]|nr:hypothetical protein [Methanomicrobiales archaeon]